MPLLLCQVWQHPLNLLTPIQSPCTRLGCQAGLSRPQQRSPGPLGDHRPCFLVISETCSSIDFLATVHTLIVQRAPPGDHGQADIHPEYYIDGRPSFRQTYRYLEGRKSVHVTSWVRPRDKCFVFQASSSHQWNSAQSDLPLHVMHPLGKSLVPRERSRCEFRSRSASLVTDSGTTSMVGSVCALSTD